MRDFINKLGNLIMPRLLRSPLHFFVSGQIMLVTFTGRKSGKVYSTPVEYKREGDTLIFFTQRDRVWWKNLQGGATVTIRLRGQDVQGQTETITDETAICTGFKRMHPNIPQAPDFGAKSVMVKIQLATVAEHYAPSRS